MLPTYDRAFRAGRLNMTPTFRIGRGERIDMAGVLARDGGKEMLGGVGISGDTSDKDEACARAGGEAAKLIGDAG